MKRLFLISITAIVLSGMFSCMEKKDAGNEAGTSTDSIEVIQPVKTMTVEQSRINRTVQLTATIAAEQETYLAPAMAGNIRSIEVDVNDRVKKGQVLVNMDPSQLVQTKVQYENLKKDLARMDTLLQYGSVTQQAYDQMKTQVNVTGVMLKNLEQNTSLRAPYDGIITGKYFNDGEMFSPAPNTPVGKAAIISMVKMDILKLNINLSESYLPLVKVGQIAKVTTDVYPKDTLSARVYRIYPTINPATRTFTVELRLDNSNYKLRPGMYSSVTLEMGDRNAVLVPAIAVLKQAGTNTRYVFIYKNGTAHKMLVHIGERLDDRLELLKNGVKEGDQLIFAGHVNLMDGDKVKLVTD